MKIQYYRIFVEKTKQLSLFDAVSSTKKELIYEAFNRRSPFYFKSGKQTLVYVTEKESGPYIFGTLGKAAHVNVQKSPEENFVTQSIESWPHVPIVINTSPHPATGQSVIIGFNRAVFEYPLRQLTALARELTNETISKKGYELAINPITDKSDFWNIVEEHKGSINSLLFNFEAPNLFNTKDSLNDELRDAKDAFAMTNAQIKLENSEGELEVPSDNKFVNEGLKYITAGGGSYKIKLRNKRVISSKEFTKTTVIDDLELDIASRDRSTLETFYDKLFSWLER